MICTRCKNAMIAWIQRNLVRSCQFSSSSRRKGYDDTIGNLKIGSHTRVIFQGFTGKQATANAKESIAWGTNIVGGVRPNKEGEHLGLPVLPTVRRAMEELKPHATGIYVAAHQAPAAIEEAIEAEVPLIVAVAEHIPLHDILRIHSMLSSQSKSRLVGANAPGIISAIGHCRIGFQPLPTFSPGHVGIVAKSGTLSYETVASLTRSGLGQSLCIGMGGDVVAGTNFVDALRVFETDDDTECVVLVGEVGGTAEEEAAAWIKDYKKRTKDPKPIAALVGGVYAKPGRVMGHAGAWAAPGEGSATTKYNALEEAGVTMVDHPAKFGGVVKQLLSSSGRDLKGIMKSASNAAAEQKRGFHTYRPRPPFGTTMSSNPQLQQRRLHLGTQQSVTLLKEYGIEVLANPPPEDDSRLLVITVDRTARSPCIIVSPTTKEDQIYQRAIHIPFEYSSGPTKADINTALEGLQMDAAPPATKAVAVDLIGKLITLYHAKEAVALEVRLKISSSSDKLEIYSPNLSFDDAAYRSTKRHSELHQQRDLSLEDPVEVSAEADGIVYIKLDAPTPNNEPRNIGTLVNGAGLAMNTVDALATHGGYAANFLDTGGKATSETVKRSFELILQDPRVKVVFVNIFGGLTLGDMIARGVILAFKELEMAVPVVVRIRGTNEKEAQKLIADSGLKLFAFDDFEEAAAKVVELSQK
ncbi:succinyl-CoA ligase-like protein subunit alpha [Tothia fuscella]|uniref:Succinyl-CoA ligase-like protein subunit alpha n=1 Tax=Tothia fuscella TaxID=1048955 RepID=A0A9P4U1W1_9PEZI|nr:succinyl-CoA ligase-like protein subunit alpha [Tothia fuscella]